MDNTGDLTGGASSNFGGVPDTFSNYTFINATDKTRLRGPFVNAQGIRFQVQNDGSIVSMGDITAFSGVGSFQSVSDIKFKTDITELSGSLDKVLELNPSRFIWKNTDKRDIGFIAQEVELVIPEIVKTDKRGVIGIDETKNTKTKHSFS